MGCLTAERTFVFVNACETCGFRSFRNNVRSGMKNSFRNIVNRHFEYRKYWHELCKLYLNLFFFQNFESLALEWNIVHSVSRDAYNSRFDCSLLF